MKKFFKISLFLILYLFFIILFILLSPNDVYGYESSDYLDLYNVAVDYLEGKNINWYDYLMLEDASGYVAFYFSCTENVDLSVYSVGANYSSYIYARNIYYIKFVSGLTIHSVINNHSNNSIIRYDTIGSGHGSIIASSFDVSVNGTVIPKNDIFSTFTPFENLSLYLSTSSPTTDVITIYSDFFNASDINKYNYYIYENDNFVKIKNVATSTDNGVSKYRYFYYILKNGTYTFKIEDVDNNNTKIITKTITNIVKNVTSSGSKIVEKNGISYGIYQPTITYTRDNTNNVFVLKTQSFNIDMVQNYRCFFINSNDYIEGSFDNWDSCGIRTVTDTIDNSTYCEFFTTIPVDSEDLTLLFVFYENNVQDYGYITTFTCDISYMNDFADKMELDFDPLGKIKDFFTQHFGFLVYPIDFITDFLNRVNNIEWEEPVVSIPQIVVPGTDFVLFEGIEYNLNSILSENEIFETLHNIYYVAVDFLLIFGFIIFLKNTLFDVLGGGKND